MAYYVVQEFGYPDFGSSWTWLVPTESLRTQDSQIVYENTFAIFELELWNE